MLLYESPYSKITLDVDARLMLRRWTEKSNKIKEQLYKEELSREIEFIEQYKPKLLLFDTRNLDFIIGHELQEWIDNNILKLFDQSGVEKVAFIMSHDVFTHASIELHMLNHRKSNYELKYFDGEEEARSWLRV